jgi:hypothetical protein
MQGYLIVRRCLDADRLRRMRAAVDAEFTLTKENTRFGFLHLGADFHNLIDHPKTLPLLREFIGPKLRLDHTYGMGMAADGRGEGENLHHEGVGGSHGIGHGSYYHTHGERIHNGLIVVAFALYDNPAGMGFSVVPGTHKTLFPQPRSLSGMDAANSYENSIVAQPGFKAGDALMFTEACRHGACPTVCPPASLAPAFARVTRGCVHYADASQVSVVAGTTPWTEPRWERRALLMKYCPHYMAFSDSAMSTAGVGGENGEHLSVRQ